MSESFRPWRPRFRLASLLWLILCVALTLGTYRWAYQRGREDALAQRTFGRSHPRVYDLKDVIPATTTGSGVLIEFNSIVQDLKKEVLPNTWQERGGCAMVVEHPNKFALLIFHDDEAHERIAAWMKRRQQQLLRQGIPTIASLAKKSPPARK
jgi:hypothetical protein